MLGLYNSRPFRPRNIKIIYIILGWGSYHHGRISCNKDLWGKDIYEYGLLLLNVVFSNVFIHKNFVNWTMYVNKLDLFFYYYLSKFSFSPLAFLSSHGKKWDWSSYNKDVLLAIKTLKWLISHIRIEYSCVTFSCRDQLLICGRMIRNFSFFPLWLTSFPLFFFSFFSCILQLWLFRIWSFHWQSK